MRRALATLTVTLSASPAGSRAAEHAALHALAVLDWSRYEAAKGGLNVDLYVAEDMPRGYLLSDGQRRLLVHPSSYAMIGCTHTDVLQGWVGAAGVRALERLLLPVALADLRK